MSRIVLAAGFAVLGALSMVTFSAVAAPDEPAAQIECADSDSCEEARPGEGRVRKGGKSGSRGRRLMEAVEGLDLTDAQRSQLDAMKAEKRSERAGKKGRRGQRGGQADLLSGELDRAAAHAALDARYDKRLERAHSELDRTMDVLDILTPEQRLALKAELRGGRGR